MTGIRLAALLAVLAFLVFPGAKAGPPADRAAVVAVIQDQLEAFHADDGVRAFSHASPGIRSMFGRPEVFMNMVRRGYLPVYRSSDVDFRDLTLEGGRWVQRVFMTGPGGRHVIARYYMQRQPDGSWKIDGVTMEDAPDLSV